MNRSLINSTLLVVAILTVSFKSANGSDLSQIDVNDLQQKLPAELANTNLTLDDAKTLFRDKCIEVAGKENGETAYVEIENALSTLSDCATNILNFTAMQTEIDEASPKGELDVVFNKYCNKQPEALGCIEAFNSKLAACLDKDEKEHQDVLMRIVRSLLNFICYKGGDQIALFIAEKGPECLESKKDDIQNCVNNTFGGYIPQNGLNDIKSLPKFVMGTKQCEEMQELEMCVVQKLEKCDEITPANIVESMFRFIKNETICHNTPRGAKQASINSGASDGVMLQQLAALSWLLYGSFFYLLIKRIQA